LVVAVAAGRATKADVAVAIQGWSVAYDP